MDQKYNISKFYWLSKCRRQSKMCADKRARSSYLAPKGTFKMLYWPHVVCVCRVIYDRCITNRVRGDTDKDSDFNCDSGWAHL